MEFAKDIAALSAVLRNFPISTASFKSGCEAKAVLVQRKSRTRLLMGRRSSQPMKSTKMVWIPFSTGLSLTDIYRYDFKVHIILAGILCRNSGIDHMLLLIRGFREADCKYRGVKEVLSK